MRVLCTCTNDPKSPSLTGALSRKVLLPLGEGAEDEKRAGEVRDDQPVTSSR